MPPNVIEQLNQLRGQYIRSVDKNCSLPANQETDACGLPSKTVFQEVAQLRTQVDCLSDPRRAPHANNVRAAQEELAQPKAQMDVLASSANNATWETVSERVASEVERVLQNGPTFKN